MRHRRAEDRHHRVPDELLDRPAVALEDGAHLLVVAGHDAAQRLGIQAFAERGRAGDVGEQDRDGLADLSRRERAVTVVERTAARLAKARGLGVFAPAGPACAHAASLGRRGPG